LEDEAMKRLTVAALAAATLLSATAIAGTIGQVEAPRADRTIAARGSDRDTQDNFGTTVPAVMGGLSGVAFVIP
jgi:hypothetical protein